MFVVIACARDIAELSELHCQPFLCHSPVALTVISRAMRFLRLVSFLIRALKVPTFDFFSIA